MTTPAVSIDEIDEGVALVKRYSVSGVLMNTQSYRSYLGGRKESRPESVSHPIGKDGWREPTYWYHNKCTTSHPPRGEAKLDWADEDPNYGYNIYENGAGMNRAPQQLSKALDKNLENRALISALSKLKSQDFNTGVFVGEGHQTLGMLATSLYRIISGVKAFKRLNPKQWKQVKKIQVGGLAKKHWRQIPQAWLELQYGWIPLMSDISGACKALNDMAQKTEPRVTVSGFAQDKYVYNEKIISSLVPGPYCNIQRTQTTKVKVTLTYTPDDADLIMKTRLGLARPDEIIWEVLPWSFVVDWFYAVGPWLGAIDADKGWSFKSGICSTKREGSDKIVSYGTTGPSSGKRIVYSNLVPATYDYAEFERRIYSESPVPAPYVKGPLSARHAVNLLALLATTFR